MNSLWVKKIYYQTLVSRAKQTPRVRFTQYYDDLSKITMQPAVDPVSYLQGTQYSYVALLNSILPTIQAEGHLNDLELIVISFWSPEFDPDYACGAYLCHRYAFAGKIVDISDCGFLSPFIALSAIQNYMQYGGIKCALLLSVDQTTVPHHALIDKCLLPHCTSVCALLIVNQLSCVSGLQLILSKRLSGKFLLDFLFAVIKEHAITMQDTLLTCNQNFSHNNIGKLLPFKNVVYTTRSGNSIEKLFSCKIFHHSVVQSTYHWHILLVQEESCDEWGVLLLRVVL